MKAKIHSSNPYSYFKYSEIEKELIQLIDNKCSFEIMERFIEYGLPPVAAFSKDVEAIYQKHCLKNPSLKSRLEILKRYFGFLVGKKLESSGYIKEKDEHGGVNRGKIKGNKFFKMGTKFTKVSGNSLQKEENPFSKISGIASIGDLTDDELNSIVYNHR
jgi:hypothetical protein